MNILIRKEEERDFNACENLIREAFWNLHKPGADEHLLLNKMRVHQDFVPELTLVAEAGTGIVGCIAYAVAKIINKLYQSYKVLIFGSLGVLPEFHGRGIGGRLVSESLKLAERMEYPCVVIYGSYDYYKRYGFKKAEEYGISGSDGKFSEALMVYELREGALRGINGRFFETDVYLDLNDDELDVFDRRFLYKEKFVTQSQKEFQEFIERMNARPVEN